MGRLDGKVALVTGAAQGIGRAIAEAFVAEGATAVLVDRQADALQEVADSLGSRAISLSRDLARLESLGELVGTAEGKVGPIDVLVNAAGICPVQEFAEVDAETLRRVMDINLTAPLLLMQEVASRARARGGPASIVNIASISAFLPKLDQLAYGASKAALVSATRSAAASLGPYGIRVNAVAPGVIDTPLTDQIAAGRAAERGVSPEETLMPTIQIVPLRHIGSPEEVAAAVVFLASDESSYITGQTLDVCGGFLMR